MREEDWNVPITMYGCNKLYCEHLGRYFTSNFRQLGALATVARLDFRSLRFPGLISAETVPTGGTSDFGPEMLHAAAQKQPYQCFVGPDAKIPFMAMPDAVTALVHLLEADRAKLTKTVYNVTAFSETAGQIADRVRAAFPGAQISFEPDAVRSKIVDSWPEDMDDSLARRRLGLEAGVRRRARVRGVSRSDDPAAVQPAVDAMTKSRTMLAIAWVAAAAVAASSTAGCGDTPPVSPSNAGVPADPVCASVAGSAARSTGDRRGRRWWRWPRRRGRARSQRRRPQRRRRRGRWRHGCGRCGGGGSADAGPDGGALSSAWLSTVSGVDTKVAALRPKFRACYTRGIKGRPQGRVVLHASVAADGSVLTVTAGENQGVTGRVVACMVDVLKGARLPAPGRVTTLDVPIAFPAP